MSNKWFFIASLTALYLMNAGCKWGTDAELLIGIKKDANAGAATAPVLTEVSSLGLIFEQQPLYIFHSDEEGTISYGGDCSSLITDAVVGNNIIQLSALAWDQEYSNCTITVTNASNEASQPLSMSSFRVVHQIALNDTGITTCGNYAFGGSNLHRNDIDCDNEVGIPYVSPPYFDTDGNVVPDGQDALLGRDSDPLTNTSSDGAAGFSFTKLDASGNDLASAAATWQCVRDNVTGLIWQYRQNNSELFTWYNTDPTKNGGAAGSANLETSCVAYNGSNPSAYCNTEAYTARINAVALCGYNDWRLPRKEELQSISHKGRSDPAIDIAYFADTIAGLRFWTASVNINSSNEAILLQVDDATEYISPKSFAYSLRLVRGDY